MLGKVIFTMDTKCYTNIYSLIVKIFCNLALSHAVFYSQKSSFYVLGKINSLLHVTEQNMKANLWFFRSVNFSHYK